MVVLGSLLGGIPLIRDHVDVWAIVLVLLSVTPVAIAGLRGLLRTRRERAATDRA